MRESRSAIVPSSAPMAPTACSPVVLMVRPTARMLPPNSARRPSEYASVVRMSVPLSSIMVPESRDCTP
ncbi:Uncharacterised protein [Bordetella pertussis]|nr:Uncharacterised protein [Bordetella pertussis]